VGTQQLDFAEFYRSAADECLRAVLVSVGDQDTARELVDEAFARAWASWRVVSRHPVPKAWVPDPGTVADLPAAGGIPASLVDPQIMAALMRLPVRQRQVVALRLILDLDTARTAEVLGIAPGTVMAHLGRALAALRHDLQPELQQENRS